MTVNASRPIQAFAGVEMFLALLRADGIVIDLTMQRRVIRLLANVQTASDTLAYNAVAQMIVPIVATNAHEQKLAHHRFKEVFESMSPVLDAPEPLHSADRKEQIDKRRSMQPRFLKLVFVTVVATTLFVGLTFWSVIEIRDQFEPSETATESSEPTQRGTLLIKDFIDNFEISELQLPEQSASNRTWRWYYTEYDWRKWLAVLLPIALYALGMLLLVWLILAQLRRQRLMENMRNRALQFSTMPVRMGDRSQITQLQPLRQFSRMPLLTLALDATVKASIAAGGLLTPRYRTRTYSKDFVAVIERRSKNDHQAAYADAFLDVLEAAGLAVERVYFHYDPNHATHSRSRQVTGLNTLIKNNPDSVFLFFFDEAALVQISTGQPQDWIKKLTVIRNRFVVLPRDSLGVADGHFARSLGFEVLECSPKGLHRLASVLLNTATPRILDSQNDVENGKLDTLNRIVDEIVLRSDRWTQATSPDAVDISMRLDELADAVGPQNLRWMAATAVYPELRWSITTYLKRLSMRGRMSTESLLDPMLMTVSRLPWYRKGFMPDWVRKALLKRVNQGEHSSIRTRILEALSLSPRSTGVADQIEINVVDDERRHKQPQRLTDSILLDFVMPRLSRESTLFNVPNSVARRMIKKPVVILFFATVFGMMTSAMASYTALSNIAINECDLYGSSVMNDERIAPFHVSRFNVRVLNAETIKTVCAEAIEAYPNENRYQHAWYLASKNVDGDTPENRLILSSLVDQSYGPALNSAGYNYEKGELGYPQDTDKAYEYYVRAFDAGSANAVHNIIVWIKGSQNSQISNLQNFDTYSEIAISSGAFHLESLYEVYRDGHTFADGSRVEADLEKYLELAEYAARLGNSRALEEMGDVYRYGQAGRVIDIPLSISYYERSFELGGSESAASILAEIYLLPEYEDFERATYLSIFALKLDEETALWPFMQMFTDSTLSIPPNDLRELRMTLQVGTQSQNAEEIFSMGETLYWMSEPDTAEEKLAISFIRRASRLGLVEATAFLKENFL